MLLIQTSVYVMIRILFHSGHRIIVIVITTTGTMITLGHSRT